MATKRIELNESGVIFNEEDHTYELNGKQLSGITDLLHRQLFPDEFDGINPTVLNAAAEYGTQVHLSCESFDKDWINDGTTEVQDYIQICTTENLSHERSEYTITDGQNWASRIDKVYRVNEDTFNIADLKTYGTMTSQKLDKARWQLSLYAYMFELQNPKAKVDRLFVIHIRNKEKADGTFDHISEILEVKRIPSEICKELLDTDIAGGQFYDPYCIPLEYEAMEDEIRSLIQTKAQVEEQLSAIKAKILTDMLESGAKSWQTDTMKITLKQSSTRSSFNLTKFREDHPNDFNYDDYMRTSTVAPSIVITI